MNDLDIEDLAFMAGLSETLYDDKENFDESDFGNFDIEDSKCDEGDILIPITSLRRKEKHKSLPFEEFVSEICRGKGSL